MSSRAARHRRTHQPDVALASRIESANHAWPTWLSILVIAVAGCLAYSNCFSVPFMRDDIASIEQNPTIIKLWPLTPVLNPPGQGNTVYARPVLNLSFALNRALFGHTPASYHAVNVAIHILNALLLFGLLRRSLTQCADGVPLVRQPPPLLPFAIALLWLLHPLQTESVTYLVQRAESLAALFYLVTLYALVRAAHELCPARRPPWRRRAWAIAATAACALGMATKETLVTAPVIALAYDRIFLSRSWRELWSTRAPLHLALFATLGIQIALLATYGRIGHDAALTAERSPPLQYLLTQTGVITHYLRLACWPRGLVFDYYDWPIAQRVAEVWPYLLFIIGLALATCYALVRHPRLGFLGFCFFALLAPTSSIMPIEDVAVEHRMYLPLIPLLALAVCAVLRAACWGRSRIRRRNPSHTSRLTSSTDNRQPTTDNRPLLPLTALCAVALLLGTLTHLRNRDYADEYTLATDTLRKRPTSARAHYDLGIALLSLKQPELAFPCFERALKLKPDYGMACFGRAEALVRLGKHAEALADYTRAYALAPQLFFIPNNRGMAALTLGRIQEALTDFNTTIARAPAYGPAYLNRGRAYAQLGQADAALRDLDRAAHLLPDSPALLVERGNLLAAQGLQEQAAGAFTRALALDPRDANIYYNRANVRARGGDLAGAMRDFDTALQLAPDMATVYNNRAALHYTLGRTREAWADIESCRRLGLEPNSNLVQLIDTALSAQP